MKKTKNHLFEANATIRRKLQGIIDWDLRHYTETTENVANLWAQVAISWVLDVGSYERNEHGDRELGSSAQCDGFFGDGSVSCEGG
jgi:hypothetical protein